MTAYDRMLKRLGLTKMMVPAGVGDVVERRIAGLWEVAYHGCDIERLPQAIKRYGFDCYTQGLLDATTPVMRARIEKMALEGVIPPMDTRFASQSDRTVDNG